MALSYYRSKPLVMVSLTDLVNMDMLMVIFATGCFILLPYTIAHLGLRLPPLAALCLVDALKFCASSVVMYLVVGAVVPYIYLRRKRASLSEDLADEQVQAGIRAAVVSLSLVLTAWNVAFDVRRTSLHNLLSRTQEPAQGHEKPAKGMHLLTVLSLVACLVQVSMRLLIAAEKKYQNCKLEGANNVFPVSPRHGKYSAQTVYSVLTFFIFLCTLAVTAGIWSHNNSWEEIVKMVFGVGGICVGLPLVFIVSNKRVRIFVADFILDKQEQVRKICRLFDNSVASIY